MQSYTNLEILLVDDGSTDSSGLICDSYRDIDSRIKVFHKENGGLSSARNVGLQYASGKYISFVDSDDFVSPVFIESMLRNIKENSSDICALDSGTDFWEGDAEPDLNRNVVRGETVTGRVALERMLYMNIVTGAPFKMCRRDILDGIYFPEGYLYEDVATTYKWFLKARKVTILNSQLYAYRKRHDSIIRSDFKPSKMICLTIAKQLIEDISQAELSLLSAAIARVFGMVFSVYLQVPKNDDEDKNKLWEWIKRYRKDILFNKSKMMRRKNRFGAMVSYLGMNMSYRLGRKFGQKGSMQ